MRCHRVGNGFGSLPSPPIRASPVVRHEVTVTDADPGILRNRWGRTGQRHLRCILSASLWTGRAETAIPSSGDDALVLVQHGIVRGAARQRGVKRIVLSGLDWVA